jgi:anti-sigma factor RsiW
MKCPEIQKIIITDFSDREAPPQMRAEVESHLAMCPVCREFEQRFNALVVRPFEQTVLKAPEDLWGAVQERILHQPETAKWYSQFLQINISLPKLAFAVGLILMLAGTAEMVYKQKISGHEAAVCVMENMSYMESLSNSDEAAENYENEALTEDVS